MTHVDAETQWRGRQDTGRWRLGALLALSGALHLVFTPWGALWGLARWLPDWQVELPPEEPVNAIPVDIIADRPNPPAAPEPPEPEPAASSKPPDSDLEDPAAPKPPPPEPQEAPPEPPAPPPPPEPAPEDHGIGDPVALSGSAGKIADANANVRLMLYTDRIRQHALGRRIGRLLQATPQWRDFFGPAQVDPIRDIDRVLIAGPQLRDSSNVVAVVQHSLSDERMEQGLDALVARGGGEWLEGKSKMARTTADRAERLIVLPAPGVVAVVPPSAEKSARSLGKDTRFADPPDGVALQAYLVTPWRVFLGLPVQIPKSIEWVRIEVQPRADGGASVRLVAQDASKEEAQRNAREIEQLIRAAAELRFVSPLLRRALPRDLIEKVSMQADGEQILGTLDLSARQLESIADLADLAQAFQGLAGGGPTVAAPRPPEDDGRSGTAPRRNEPEKRSAPAADTPRPEEPLPGGEAPAGDASPGASPRSPTPSEPSVPSPPTGGASRPPDSDPTSAPQSDDLAGGER